MGKGTEYIAKLTAWLSIGSLRLAERILPLFLLRKFVAAFVFVHAIRHKPTSTHRSRRESFQSAIDSVLLGFPDRLIQDRWMKRCRWSGIDKLQEALQAQEPTVLIVLHQGPLFLLPHLLRAKNIPCSILVEGKSQDRTAIRRFRDRFHLLRDLPVVWHLDELRRFSELPKQGVVLILAVDENRGKQIEISIGNHRSIQMATGAFRIAARHQAMMFPCSIERTANWTFQIKIGEPVRSGTPEQISDIRKNAESLATQLFNTSGKIKSS